MTGEWVNEVECTADTAGPHCGAAHRSHNWQTTLLNIVASFSRCLQGVDNSREYATQLLGPPLGSPPHLDDLHRFIQGPPAAQIPISVDALSAVRLPPALQSHFRAASGQLAFAIGASLASPLRQGGSAVVWTVIMEHVVVVSLLQALDNALPASLRIGYDGNVQQVLCVTLLAGRKRWHGSG